jgi:hypothetical protein
MKPNLIDRFVLKLRKHFFVPLFDKCVRISDVEDIPWAIPSVIGMALLYFCGYPFMLWIRLRGLTALFEDDDHWNTYPCRLIHGESGHNWRREGF